MNSDANIARHLSIIQQFFFTSIWWITVDMLVINVVEKYFRLGLKYLIPLRES